MGSGVNPWDAIESQARGGSITVDHEVAKNAVGYVADALNMVETVQGHVKDVEKYQGFGNLPSGAALASKFFHAAGDLDTRLNDHKEILRSMGETFVLAGKLYEHNESETSSAFDGIKNDRYSHRPPVPDPPAKGTAQPPQWGYNTKSDAKLPDLPSDLQGLSGTDNTPVTADPAPVKPVDNAKKDSNWTESPQVENAYSLEYNTYYSLGQSINDHAGEIGDAAGVWGWMGNQLNTAFTNLSNQITSLQESGAWTGQGASSAVSAASAYQGNVANLTKDMHLVSENLNYTFGWLTSVSANMPNIPWENVGKPYARDYLLPQARAAFQTWYVAGIHNSSNAIPVLPAAESPVNQPPGNQPPGNRPPGNQPPGSQPPGSQPPGNKSGSSPDGNQGDPKQSAEDQRKQQDAARRLQDQQKALGNLTPQQQQAEQARQRAQQAAQQAAQQVSQQGQQALQQAMQAGQQAAQQASQQSLAGMQKDLTGAGLPAGLAGLPGALGAKGGGGGGGGAKGGGGKGGGGVGGGGVGGGPHTELSRENLQTSKLFPRAAVSTAADAAIGHTGIAAAGAQGQQGMPGGMGAAGHGAGAGGGAKERKRPDYLNSDEHLEEALGEAPRVVKPVVEQ